MLGLTNICLSSVATFLSTTQPNEVNFSVMTTTAPILTAPASIWIEAPDIPSLSTYTAAKAGQFYDPTFSEITYVWTLRGQIMPPFSAPQNMVEGWNDPHKAYGKAVAFCVSEPGEYSIELLAIDHTGATATGVTETFTVLAPDNVYQDLSTVVIALDGQFAGKPSGAREVSSIAELQAVLQSASEPLRALFKRGEEYSDVHIRIDNSKRLTHVGAWGDLAAAKPVLRPQYRGRSIFEIWQDHHESQFTVENLDFRGDWDATRENGWYIDSPISMAQSQRSDTIYTIFGCNSGGFAKSYSFSFGNNPAYQRQRVMLANCTTEGGWNSYGLFVGNSNKENHVALIGNRLVQDINALDGGGAKNLGANEHGPVRLSNTSNSYISQNDLFSRSGWSRLNPGFAEQPCLRLDTSGESGARYVVERNVMEGGYIIVKMDGSDGAKPDNPGNYLLDKNLLIATAKRASSPIVNGKGGTTYRNNIGIIFDTGTYQGGNSEPRALVSFSIDNDQNANKSEPVMVYNNTLLNLESTENDRGKTWSITADRSVGDIFEEQIVENNLLHFPNGGTPSQEFGPLDISQTFAGITPRWKGTRYGFQRLETTVPAGGIVPGGTLFVPYTAFTSEMRDGTQSGTITDQSYWLAVPSTDTRHFVVSDGSFYHAHVGEFSVSFADPNYVQITNTSGSTWPAGAIHVQLDRSALIPAMDTSRASPSTVPIPRLSGPVTEARQARIGLVAYDNFFGEKRQFPSPKGAI